MKAIANKTTTRYVSDLISVHRSLPDLRGEWCKEKDRFLETLPPTSVIVCFHNEVKHSFIHTSSNRPLQKALLVYLICSWWWFVFVFFGMPLIDRWLMQFFFVKKYYCKTVIAFCQAWSVLLRSVHSILNRWREDLRENNTRSRGHCPSYFPQPPCIANQLLKSVKKNNLGRAPASPIWMMPKWTSVFLGRLAIIWSAECVPIHSYWLYCTSLGRLITCWPK